VDIKKLLREHEEGNDRLRDMSNRRTKLLKMIKDKDFKSFHTELRDLPDGDLSHPLPSPGRKKAGSIGV
jgi:hypothetical protein